MRKIKNLLLTVGLFAFLFSGFHEPLAAQPYPALDDNIAKFKPAEQSSTLDYKSLAYRAVDGNTNGNWTTPGVMHTNLEHNAWWEVDLLDQYNITEITLYNRTDAYGNRLSNFTISVSDQPMKGSSNGSLFASETGAAGKSKTYKGQKTGRYVRIQLNDRSAGRRDYLHMAEVEIKGELVKSLPRPKNNVALGKPARQSSVYNGWAEANLANDGNTDGSFHSGSVTSTNADLGAWWEVDLGEVYEVSEVTLYNRTDEQSQRLSDFVIRYSENPMNDGGDGNIFYQAKDYPRIFRKCTPSNDQGKVLARYIRVALNGRNNLSLAEVQVTGKLPGKIIEAPDPINDYYWTYIKRENTGDSEFRTTLTNSVEKAAGYQLEESSSKSSELSLEVGSSLGISIKGILDVSSSWKVGTILTNTSSTNNSSSASKTVKGETQDDIPIPASTTVYFFTKWRERKNKVVVAYDGINWPYTATTDIKPAGEGTVFEYGVNDDIAQELKQYKAGQAIPEEVYQKIRAHNLAYKRQKDETGGTVVGTTGTTSTGINPSTPTNTAKEVKFYSQNSLSLAEAQAIAKENGWEMASGSEVEAAFEQQNLNVWAYGRIADGRFAVPVQSDQSNFQKGPNIGVTGGNQGFFYTISGTPTSTSEEAYEDNDDDSSSASVTVVQCSDNNGKLVGYFMLEDGTNNWIETDADGGTKFTYQETGKEGHAIHLYDTSRNVGICLEFNLGQVLYSDSNNTTPFSIYTISEAY
ncbi:MAG: discoidin domain-containing protein [Lewinellaceae bacterium]|nr:discoidin domain-containing protein [Phaeodactylibacter sp.]MCB9352172.1 discoidin domain-containing protein [Lewinellaceae bacterium]